MKRQLKYFIFNKTRDYAEGCLEHMECDADGIWVSGQNADGRGTFFSRILDSQETDMEWHRLVFDVNREFHIPYRITVFAANSLEHYGIGPYAGLRELTASHDLTFDRKMELLAPFKKKEETGIHDLLLYGVAGRYLWIALELFQPSGQRIKLGHMRVYFPKQSWITYLPEVYQSGDTDHFLERYLAIFETLHETMDQRIREIPDMLDADTTGSDFLVWLSQWLDIAGSYMWSDKQLRVLLKNGISLYRKRGTREGILTFIRLYTGGEAYLVEYHQLENFMGNQNQRKNLTRLYGGTPYVLSVILKKLYVKTRKEYKALIRVIDEIKPAQTQVNLIVLEPYMYLGGHTYMGINSAFGEYRNLILDGLSMLPFSTI